MPKTEVLDTHEKKLIAWVIMGNLASGLLEINKDEDLELKVSLCGTYEDAMNDLGIIIQVIENTSDDEKIELYFSIDVKPVSKAIIEAVLADAKATKIKDNVILLKNS